MFDSDDLDAIPGLLDGVESALGPIDIYIANTGGPPPNPDPLGFTREQWAAAHRTLVLSPMTILQRLLPQMAERGWGRVVAVQSSAVHEPIAALRLSNAHRPGMVAGFKVLAKQYAGKGVTLNTLPSRPHRAPSASSGRAAIARRPRKAAARDTDPGRPPRRTRRPGRRRRVPVLRAGELHHRRHPAGRRRRDRRRLLNTPSGTRTRDLRLERAAS